MSEYCESHIELVKDIAVIKENTLGLRREINGAVQGVEQHIKNGAIWRGIIVSCVLSIAIQVVIFAFFYGQAKKQLDINTVNLVKIEERLFKK